MLKVGIAGLGWFGSIHAETWSSIPGVEVVGYCDMAGGPSAGRAQDDFHKDAGGNRARNSRREPFFANFEDMLDAVEIDLVDVVVPESVHFEIASAALRRGKHVLVEKPFVISPMHCDELVRLARERGRHIYVGQILRFDHRYRATAQLIRDSAAAIRHMSFSRHFQSSAHSVYGRISPFFGALVHDIDVAIWMAGRAPDRVTSFSRSFFGRSTPDCVVGVLEWRDGHIAVLQNAWHLASGCPYGFSFESEILTNGSTYRIRNVPVVEIWNERGTDAPEFFFWPLIGDERAGALREELAHFALCARADAASDLVPIEQIAAGIKVAHALMAAAESGGSHDVDYGS